MQKVVYTYSSNCTFMELKYNIALANVGSPGAFKLYLYGIEIVARMSLEHAVDEFKLYLYGIEMSINFASSIKTWVQIVPLWN